MQFPLVVRSKSRDAEVSLGRPEANVSKEVAAQRENSQTASRPADAAKPVLRLQPPAAQLAAPAVQPPAHSPTPPRDTPPQTPTQTAQPAFESFQPSPPQDAPPLTPRAERAQPPPQPPPPLDSEPPTAVPPTESPQPPAPLAQPQQPAPAQTSPVQMAAPQTIPYQGRPAALEGKEYVGSLLSKGPRLTGEWDAEQAPVAPPPSKRSPSQGLRRDSLGDGQGSRRPSPGDGQVLRRPSLGGQQQQQQQQQQQPAAAASLHGSAAQPGSQAAVRRGLNPPVRVQPPVKQGYPQAPPERSLPGSPLPPPRLPESPPAGGVGRPLRADMAYAPGWRHGLPGSSSDVPASLLTWPNKGSATPAYTDGTRTPPSGKFPGSGLVNFSPDRSTALSEVGIAAGLTPQKGPASVAASVAASAAASVEPGELQAEWSKIASEAVQEATMLRAQLLGSRASAKAFEERDAALRAADAARQAAQMYQRELQSLRSRVNVAEEGRAAAERAKALADATSQQLRVELDQERARSAMLAFVTAPGQKGGQHAAGNQDGVGAVFPLASPQAAAQAGALDIPATQAAAHSQQGGKAGTSATTSSASPYTKWASSGFGNKGSLATIAASRGDAIEDERMRDEILAIALRLRDSALLTPAEMQAAVRNARQRLDALPGQSWSSAWFSNTVSNWMNQPTTPAEVMAAQSGALAGAQTAGEPSKTSRSFADSMSSLWSRSAGGMSNRTDGSAPKVHEALRPQIGDLSASMPPSRGSPADGQGLSGSQKPSKPIPGPAGTIAAGRQDGKVSFSDLASGTTAFELAGGSHVLCVGFNAAGDQVAIGCMDGSLRFFNAATAAVKGTLQFRGRINGVAWLPAAPDSPGGVGRPTPMLVVACNDQKVHLVDTAVVAVRKEIPHPAIVRSVSCGSTGSLYASGCDDNKLRVYNGATNEQECEVAHGGAVKAIAWGRTDQSLATGCDDKIIRIVVTKTGQVTKQIVCPSVVAMAWMGQVIAVAGDDGKLRLLSLPTSSVEKEIAHDGSVLALAPNTEGTVLATGCDDGQVRLVNVQSGKVVKEFYQGSAVTSVSWSVKKA
eukprot:TRINITY_DN12559_c0_g1_i3.p1 TRINITY_DN12559_c0_g1~~TRINITY_DN12559_c0_g1_i3.p1  ORF type:complete len:1074 (+),score=257.13 TRINITY_DN12559_c0_g1_i3:107-3328(+)